MNDPPIVVTATLFEPEVEAGVMALMIVAVGVPEIVACTPPMKTFAPSKFVPTMVTTGPPALTPESGVTDVMVGGKT